MMQGAGGSVQEAGGRKQEAGFVMFHPVLTGVLSKAHLICSPRPVEGQRSSAAPLENRPAAVRLHLTEHLSRKWTSQTRHDAGPGALHTAQRPARLPQGSACSILLTRSVIALFVSHGQVNVRCCMGKHMATVTKGVGLSPAVSMTSQVWGHTLNGGLTIEVWIQ